METYGLAKQGGQRFAYTGVRGYHPLLASLAETGELLHTRLRAPFERLPHHSEQVPALVLAHLDHDRNVGRLITHNPYGRGIKTILVTALKQRFNEDFEQRNLALHVDPLIPGDVVDSLLDHGELKKVKLVKYEPSPDLFDNLSGYVEPEDVGALETVVSAKKFGILRRREGFEQLAKGVSPDTLFTLGNVDYDEIKLEVRKDGKTRVVRLGHETGLRKISYDITAEVQYEDGYPTYESLRSAALDLL